MICITNPLFNKFINRSEPSQNFNQPDANTENFKIVRVGGYRTNLDQNPSSGVLVVLVFRVTEEFKNPISLSIIATYDDIQNASVKNGTIFHQKSS